MSASVLSTAQIVTMDMRRRAPEPTLIFKPSDQTVFRCSACHKVIASDKHGELVVGRIIDLISKFEKHVRRYHSEPTNLNGVA
jgi:hypothetical protein